MEPCSHTQYWNVFSNDGNSTFGNSTFWICHLIDEPELLGFIVIIILEVSSWWLPKLKLWHYRDVCEPWPDSCVLHHCVGLAQEFSLVGSVMCSILISLTPQLSSGFCGKPLQASFALFNKPWMSECVCVCFSVCIGSLLKDEHQGMVHYHLTDKSLTWAQVRDSRSCTHRSRHCCTECST